MNSCIKNISILVSNPVDQDTPEVTTFVNSYIDALKATGVGATVRVGRLNRDILATEALNPPPDLLVIIGHGNENGRLLFEAIESDFMLDNRRCGELIKYADLPENIRRWFSKTGCVLICACHGSRWIPDGSDVRWIAFDEEIPQRQTTLLIQRLSNPDGTSLLSQIDQAMSGSLAPEHELWLKSKRSSHSDPAQYPGYGSGKLELEYASAESFGTHDLIMFGLDTSDVFVGRQALLYFLTIPPVRETGLPPQRITWIRAEAGMGKSALLRKAVERLRSLWFESKDAKPVLISRDFANESNWESAIKEIAEAIKNLIAMNNFRYDRPEDCLKECFKELSKTKRPLVLILDDTTYLDIGLNEESQNASRLINLLYELARAHNIRFHVITTNRYPPVGVAADTIVELLPLTLPEAALLVYLLHCKWGKCPEMKFEQFVKNYLQSIGILFYHLGQNTKRFRGILEISQQYGWDLNMAARELVSGHFDLNKIDEELVKKEWELADQYGQAHRINWSGFLLTLYPLTRWIQKFSAQQYQDCLGNWTLAERSPLELGRSVQKCLDLARVKGILESQAGFYRIVPNYRIQAAAFTRMRGVEDRIKQIETDIRKSYPAPLGVSERLALCLDLAQKSLRDSLPEFEALEKDFSNYEGSSDEIDAALAVSMRARTELAHHLGDIQGAINIISTLESKFGSHKSPAVVEQVAKALFNQTENIRETTAVQNNPTP